MSYLPCLAGAALFLFTAPAVSSSERNAVAEYLTNAECQHETDQQKKEIATAMSDILHLPAMALRHKRYRTYAGVPGQWTVLDLLKKYCVPEHRVHLNESSFYKDFQAPPAKLAVSRQLNELR